MRALVLLFYILFYYTSNVFGQYVIIRNDTLITGGDRIGILIRDGNSISATYISGALKNKYFALVTQQIQQKCSSCSVSNDVDKYLFFPPLSINESTIFYDGISVGQTSLESFSKGYLVKILIETRAVDKDDYRYIEDEVRSQLKSQLRRRVVTELDVDFSKEDSRIQNEEEERRAKHIAQFYEAVYSRLSGELEPVEGVYRSIFKGDQRSFDIVILKKLDQYRQYEAYVFESRKGSLKVGYSVFSLESTANQNSFLVDYTTIGGFEIDDKLAILDQGMINLGVRSFIKMFPAEGQNENYDQLRPKVDFDASGSGIIISPEGLVLTNHHVIDGASSIIIQLTDSNGNKIESKATVIREQSEKDIAILQLSDKSVLLSNFQYPSLTSEAKLGQEVYTMGYPISTVMGENMKVVDGIVSSLTGPQDDDRFIQTSLPVWYGNSGGPCFNKNGELIGLVTGILYHKGEKAEGVTYVTKSSGIIDLMRGLEIESSDLNADPTNLENLIELYGPLSVFIKVSY